MNVHEFGEPPSAELARALADFERQFVYPLGEGRWFRISHGEDYCRFFRALGPARCFAAYREGQIAGTLCAARRRLCMPDGTEIDAAYFADLKVASVAQRGRVVLELFAAARQWAGTEELRAALAVVMDGTASTPRRYTGRLGIPAFESLGQIAVLRISTAEAEPDAAGALEPEPAAARAEQCHRLLCHDRCWAIGGDPGARSECRPQWLLAPDGSACGRLEDTRRAKRLIEAGGSEMMTAHLSSFAYRDVPSGAKLLRAALAGSRRLGFPAMFVALVAEDAAPLLRCMSGVPVLVAPATIFGIGIPPGLSWSINTAEI